MSESLYQRGADGYPVGADHRMRAAYGRIPEATEFQHAGVGRATPVQVHGWAWSNDFGRWSALVTFANGWHGYTYPAPAPAREPPAIASPDDIDFERARRAYTHISHTPDDRARQDQQAYVADVQSLYDELAPLATTEAQQQLLADEIERYKAGYQQRFSAMLDAKSRTASPMITGPANFPTARNQKRMATEDNRRNEFLEWRERARRAVKETMLDARTPEAKLEDEWQALERDIARSLATIHGVDTGAEHWDRSAFVNSIAGKVERLAASGQVELVERAIARVRDYNAEHAKPAITARHRFWSLADVAREARTQAQTDAGKASETIAAGDGFTVEANHAADRVQIFFDGKPDEETRGALKAAGWHWSRSEGAWQRKLTNAAIASARQLLGADAAIEQAQAESADLEQNALYTQARLF